MRSSVVYCCVGLISISSLAGCSLFNSGCDDCCNNRPVARMVVRNGVVVAQTPTGTPATTTISGSSRPIAAPTEQTVVMESAKPPAPEKLPPIPVLPAQEPVPFRADAIPLSQEGSLGQKNILPSPIELEKGRETTAIIDPALLPRPASADKDLSAKEKTVAPKNEHIQYGHSEDFKTVTGRVQMWRNTVRVRYAPIDQEDRYGGFVVLEGGAELTKIRDGQHIRIRGVLIAPEDRNGAARYRVQGIEILD